MKKATIGKPLKDSDLHRKPLRGTGITPLNEKTGIFIANNRIKRKINYNPVCIL